MTFNQRILGAVINRVQYKRVGTFLSTTHFSIKINDIVKCLGNLIDCSLYVDDFCICYRSKSMATIECQLQQNLNKIENWATSNGFKFSKSKTQCVHFCQLRKQQDDRFYIYMDHQFQLLRNLNSMAFYLIENSVLYPILNISKLNV